ncbi:biopolymer transporter ExbD [Akkermansiaceae bacterium]|nr:biopolymer transporter ExbD [Akkermansiaceae bacterium]
MKRKHTLSQRQFKSDDPQLDISSLVDVSFLLLIFFLVATSIVRKEKDLSIQQGSPNGGRISEQEIIRINLDEKGAITLKSGTNEEIVEIGGSGSDLPNLRERLSLVKDLTADGPTVHVSSDEGSEYQRFIDILNCLAEVKITSVGIVDSGETFQ